MSTLTLTAAQLDSLAALRDDPAVLPVLQRARASRNMAFLAVVLRSGGLGVPPEAWRVARAGFDTLVAAQRRAPAAVRRILEHPRFGGWAALCAADPSEDSLQPGELHPVAHLASFAAAAGVMAGQDFRLELPRIEQAVVIPAIGCWTGLSERTAVIRSAGGGAPAEPAIDPAGSGRVPKWSPVRTLSSAAASGTWPATVELDDLPATPGTWSAPGAMPGAWSRPFRFRVSDEQHRYWQERFADGLRLLDDTVPELAGPLRRGIRAILPLDHTHGLSRAVTFADAFGAAGMSMPQDSMTAAIGFLHEFQHSKLGALNDLLPLITAGSPADLYSPWREDARPVGAVLHGAFAHLPIALLCRRAPARLGPDTADWTAAYSELVRVQTIAACDSLLGSGRLTAVGRRFVSIAAETAAAIGAAFPVERGHRIAAQEALERHRSDWPGRAGDIATGTSGLEQSR